MNCVITSKNFEEFHLGIICRCKANETIGIIHGLKKHPYNGVKQVYEQKYVYFSKGKELVLPDKTLVFYLSEDSNKFSTYDEYLIPFDSINRQCDSRDKFRPYSYNYREDDYDGVYHDDSCWNCIVNGIPYLNVDDHVISLIHSEKIRERYCDGYYCYLIDTVFDSLENYLIRCALEIEKTLAYYDENNFDNLGMYIEKVYSYIESLNVEEIISTYRIIRREQLYIRVRKDDQYFIHKESYLESDDSYLQMLLPVKCELLHYESNWCSSDGDNTGVYYLQEETEKKKQEARLSYSKGRHLAFLIQERISEEKELAEKLSDLRDTIYEYLVPKNAIYFNNHAVDQYIQLINEFNSKDTKIEYPDYFLRID